MNGVVKLGIVGLGNWSRQIFKAVQQLDNVKISACCSRYFSTAESFAAEYDCQAFEQYDDMVNSLKREKQLKAWNRAWKIKLIEKNNSSWNDLYENII